MRYLTHCCQIYIPQPFSRLTSQCQYTVLIKHCFTTSSMMDYILHCLYTYNHITESVSLPMLLNTYTLSVHLFTHYTVVFCTISSLNSTISHCHYTLWYDHATVSVHLHSTTIWMSIHLHPIALPLCQCTYII